MAGHEAAAYLEQLAQNVSASSLTLKSKREQVSIPMPRIARMELSATEAGGEGRLLIRISLAAPEEAQDEQRLIF